MANAASNILEEYKFIDPIKFFPRNGNAALMLDDIIERLIFKNALLNELISVLVNLINKKDSKMKIAVERIKK